MSRYLNDEEYSAARQALVDAGYSESGADTELEKHQEKYRSTTDSLIKHFNDSNAQRLATEGIGAALATYGAVEAGKGIYNRMFKKPETPVQAVEPSLDNTKPLANRVGSEPVLFEDTTFSPEKVPTAEQAAQEQVKQGKIKSGKAGGAISPQEGQILGNEIAGKVKSEVADVVKGAVAPKTSAAEPVAVEGRIPSYPNPKRNKQGKDVIGQGGWHWYQGQMGPEAEQQWLRQFGRTNQTYADVKQAIKEGRLQGAEVKDGKGGSFPREATVPEYIRGSAPIETMARTGLAALGILPVAKKIKEGDYKGALNEAIPAMAMIAPALSLAASPLYTSEEEKDTLKAMKQKGFKSFKELEDYKKQVGAGRGIAPPSDYMR